VTRSEPVKAAEPEWLKYSLEFIRSPGILKRINIGWPVTRRLPESSYFSLWEGMRAAMLGNSSRLQGMQKVRAGDCLFLCLSFDLRSEPETTAGRPGKAGRDFSLCRRF
jgi:hypothetical protein